jgi:RimJ/RimL family protein N-acetyltransferase
MFREVKENDFDLVYSIYMEDSTIRYMSFEKITKDEFKEIFNHLKSRDEFLLFEEKEEIVGIITVSRGKWRKKHVATIGGVAVPSSHQGKGVATRMITKLIDYLANTGISRLELFVESDNPGAINLYNNLGFKEEGLLRGYFKRETDSLAIDELVMAKII